MRFLHAYNPDLNLIEQALAKLKAFLRDARPRSFDDVCAWITWPLPHFSPAECANYIATAGIAFPLHRCDKRSSCTSVDAEVLTPQFGDRAPSPVRGCRTLGR